MIETDDTILKGCRKVSKNIEKIDAKDIGIFVKFVEESYVSSTLDGKLYFASSTYFRDHEAKYKDEKMGDVNDPYESSDGYVMRTDEIFIRMEGQQKIFRLPVKKVGINFKTVKSYGICSFMYLSFFDFEEDPTISLKVKEKIKEEFHVKNNLKIFRLKPEVIDQLKKFQKIEEKNKHAKCVPLIFSNNELLRVVQNLKNSMGYGLVNYHDFHKEVEIDEIPDYSKKPDVAVLFNKDISYAGQREYRLIKNISKDSKGELFNYLELKGHIFKSSISDLEQRRLLIGYHGSDLFVEDK